MTFGSVHNLLFFQHWIGASSYCEQVAQVLNKVSHHWISKRMKINKDKDGPREMGERNIKIDGEKKIRQMDTDMERQWETEMKRQLH